MYVDCYVTKSKVQAGAVTNSIKAGSFIITFFYKFVCFYIFGADSDLIAYFVA
jgi:hypothetical protein